MTQARGDGDAGTARGHAGPALGAPGIARRCHGRMVVREGTLREFDLAEDDRAGGLESAHHLRVLAADAVAVDRRTDAVARALQLDQVLDGNGHAMERARRHPCRERSVTGTRGRQGALGQHAAIGAIAIGRGLDAREHVRRERLGGDRTGGEDVRDGDEIDRVQLLGIEALGIVHHPLSCSDDLAGIENPFRIEGDAHAPHEFDLLRRPRQGQPALLLEADAVFSGDPAADRGERFVDGALHGFHGRPRRHCPARRGSAGCRRRGGRR